jgi:hypothetical protein
MFRWGLFDGFKSLQHRYWIFSSSEMLLQLLTIFRRIVAMKQLKKSRCYLAATSLFVCRLHMPVWVCCGTFLWRCRWGHSCPIPSFLSYEICLICVVSPDIAVLQYATLLDQRLTHVRSVFTAEARYVYSPVLPDISQCETPTIDHVFTYAKSRHCLHLLRSAFICIMPGHAVAQWLRHCATNRKVAGSIPDGVIGIFHWQSFRPHNGRGVDWTSNRNEYQEYFLG